MKSITITPAGYGHFTIITMYRGRSINTITTNTLAIDRYQDTDAPAKQHKDGGFTRAQAARALYNQIVRANKK